MLMFQCYIMKNSKSSEVVIVKHRTRAVQYLRVEIQCEFTKELLSWKRVWDEGTHALLAAATNPQKSPHFQQRPQNYIHIRNLRPYNHISRAGIEFCFFFPQHMVFVSKKCIGQQQDFFSSYSSFFKFEMIWNTVCWK